MFCVINLRGIIKFLIALLFIVILVFAGMVGINTLYPLRHLNIINRNAQVNGLDPAFLCAVIHAESKFDRAAVSHKDAKGLMQLTEPTANWLASEMKLENYSYEKILEPEINISIGSYYLKKLLAQYNYDSKLALAAYNAGSGNVNKWLKNPEYSTDGQSLTNIPFKETRDYIERVKQNYKIYRILMKIN